MNKRVLVAWSGGLDSTYLIQHYLDKGYGVDAVACVLKNARPSQMKRELAARKKMLKGYFRGKDVNLVGTSHIEFDGYCFASMGLSQPPIWLLNLIVYIRPEHTEVAMGYVMNDDAVSFLDVISGIWNSYAGIIQIPLPPMVFPLIKYKKTRVYGEIHYELRQQVTWCESPEKADRCGYCPSCRKMIDLGLQLLPIVEKENTMENPTLSEEETVC